MSTPAPAVAPIPASTPPSTPRRTRLNRDQRRDIQLLRRRGDSYEDIAQFLEVSIRAVQYTCNNKKATPQHKKAGRPAKLTSEEIDDLIEFIKGSRKTRRMTYEQLRKELYSERDIGVEAIKYALRSRGYTRCVALRKPPISEKNRQIRLAWAHEHLEWTREQWYSILWTDETWVVPGKHRRTWVTRCPGEELDDTCVVDKVRRKSGWIFWGCFAGVTKGPHVFWEKEWGTIDAESYQQHIVPIIDGWIKMNPHLYLMQDNAPGHKAEETR